MAASDVTIANLALSRLRAGTISSMGENSPAGKYSSIWYDESRKQLLESFDSLSWLLSYNLAWPLTGKGELQDRAERGFNISMRAAAAHDANEQKYEPRRQASWIEARN